MKRFRSLLWLAGGAIPVVAGAYPLDGFETTRIGRLAYQALVESGEMKGQKLPPGSLLSNADVQPRLLSRPDFDLPPPDPEFSAALRGLLSEPASRYALAVLDLSNPDAPRYAELNGDVKRNPGSVGKILVALAVFQALADIYPDDVEKRIAVLRETVVTADAFALTDSHTVKFFDPATRRYDRHPLKIGDKATLYEYLDWMMSASSNSAASMLIKHAMMMREYGTAYPVPDAEIDRYFKETPLAERDRLLARTLEEPVTRNGMDLDQLRQGRFFTRNANAKVTGTSSHGTAREMMKFMLRMEQGRLVDVFSSTEIKRLFYQSERRIRYASSPALAEAAVYFKSGSLFRCEPEPGFECKKYMGNALNLMNSAAIVEAPARTRNLHYLVTLMSDVRRKNSAVDHQTLATRIQRLIEKHHGLPPGGGKDDGTAGDVGGEPD